MTKKLVWVEFDDDGSPSVQCPCGHALYEHDSETCFADGCACSRTATEIIASLPSSLLIGAEEREELAKTIYDCDALGHDWKWDDAGDYARRKREKYLAVCDAILAAGWRKVAAVDREKLVDEIARLWHEGQRRAIRAVADIDGPEWDGPSRERRAQLADPAPPPPRLPASSSWS